MTIEVGRFGDICMETFFEFSIGFVPLPKEATTPNSIQIFCHLQPVLCEQEYMDTQTNGQTDGHR